MVAHNIQAKYPMRPKHNSGSLGVGPTQDVLCEDTAQTARKCSPQQSEASNHITHNLNLLGECPPLDRQDDAVLAPDSDGGRTLPDGLHGVLDLEEVAVGAEDGDGAIVAHLGDSWEILFSGRWWAYGARGLGERCGHATAATKNTAAHGFLPCSSIRLHLSNITNIRVQGKHVSEIPT